MSHYGSQIVHGSTVKREGTNALSEKSKIGLLAIIGPGIIIAATGVGAGDLATGAFVGSKVGLAVAWAVILGALMKWLLTEGLTRWQLATDTTLLEGIAKHFGRPAQYLFLAYYLIWTFFVGLALLNATGVTFHAIVPWQSPEQDALVYGIAQAALAVVLVRIGGYKLFEKMMSLCIGVMFITVIVAAIGVKPSWIDLAKGIFVPTITDLDSFSWTVALMGGVGGTVTILCYGYWIREVGRSGGECVNLCRIDLAVGYVVTAVFGIGMVILGSRIEVEGKGAALVVQLADTLRNELADGVGSWAAWAFLLGAWGAVFSSLLGCMQSVPYLFADSWRLMFNHSEDVGNGVDTKSRPYVWYMYGMAAASSAGFWVKESAGVGFQEIQKWYAIVGAAFMPILAIALCIMNRRWIGEKYRTSLAMQLALFATIAFFALYGILEIRKKLA